MAQQHEKVHFKHCDMNIANIFHERNINDIIVLCLCVNRSPAHINIDLIQKSVYVRTKG